MHPRVLLPSNDQVTLRDMSFQRRKQKRLLSDLIEKTGMDSSSQ